MALDLEEQEQLATINAWWKQYGSFVTWVLIIALSGYVSWTGWHYYQRNQSVQAAQLYEELQKAVAAKDNVKVQRAATDIQERFARTAHAQMSALMAAKSAFDANDAAVAKAQLQWVINKGLDAKYKAIAKVRLAGILLDDKAYEEALKLLNSDFPPSFAAVVADRKGDILVAQDKIEEARVAYQFALEKEDQKNPGRQLIQLKLDAIGGSVTKVAG
jgi:predicted negative regulator of RcsB-dependent stress response